MTTKLLTPYYTKQNCKLQPNCILIIIGLVTLNEMKAKQEDVVKAREFQIVVNRGETKLTVDASDSEARQRDHGNQVR